LKKAVITYKRFKYQPAGVARWFFLIKNDQFMKGALFLMLTLIIGSVLSFLDVQRSGRTPWFCTFEKDSLPRLTACRAHLSSGLGLERASNSSRRF